MTDWKASRNLILRAFDDLTIELGQLAAAEHSTEIQLKFALLRQAVETFINQSQAARASA